MEGMLSIAWKELDLSNWITLDAAAADKIADYQ